MAVASLICGILGLIGGWIPVVQYFTLILSIIGLILGIIARKKAAQEGQPKGMATAGIVLSIIGLAFAGIIILCTICVVGLGAAGAFAGM